MAIVFQRVLMCFSKASMLESNRNSIILNWTQAMKKFKKYSLQPGAHP
jgi:hypothetical protein